MQNSEDLFEEDPANCCDQDSRQELEIWPTVCERGDYPEIRSQNKESTARNSNKWLDDKEEPTLQVVGRWMRLAHARWAQEDDVARVVHKAQRLQLADLALVDVGWKPKSNCVSVLIYGRWARRSCVCR